MNGPRVGVLALQGDVREHLIGLRAVGAQPVVVRRTADLVGLAGLILPGGESTTIGKLLGVFGLLEPLRAALLAGLPAFGTCSGLILLAREVLDGRPDQATLGVLDVSVRRNAFGSQVNSFEADVEVEGVPGGPVRGIFIRAPWVEAVGAGVEVLARSPDGAGSAGGLLGIDRIVAVRQGPVLATSFHPELTGDVRVHRRFLEIVKEHQT